MASIEILGTAQDAGVPHIGCQCSNCERARVTPERVRHASAILLRDEEQYLFDATPDIRFQIESIPEAVFLTHAHLGHLPGVLYFGREASDADRLPVHCTDGLADVVNENAPLSLLVENGNITLESVSPTATVELDTTIVTSYSVTHREALPTGTLAYRIDGPTRSVLYMSDIDGWGTHEQTLVDDADIAFVDGTFWSLAELDRADEVPHPAVETSIDVLDGTDTEVYFTHLNHTNPLVADDSKEYQRLVQTGFDVLEEGYTFEL